MAVGSGRYKHPEGASERLVKLIDAMLVVDPEKRPDIQQVSTTRLLQCIYTTLSRLNDR